MCVVATPFVVRQVQSKRRAVGYCGSPSVHPTLNPFRHLFVLGGFLVAPALVRVEGTDRFVTPLPICLLALLGLYTGLHACQ